MKKNLLLPMACLLSFSVTGQQFQNKVSFKLQAGSQPLQVAWADANNDSLLDIILSVKNQNQVSLVAYKNPDQGASGKIVVAATPFRSGTFTLCDFNQDNKIDLAFSGTDSLQVDRTEVYINQGSFIFQKLNTTLLSLSASRINFSDLNNDAQKELVLINTSGAFTAFKNKGQNFSVLFDSSNMKAQDFAIFDFDGNGFNDIAVSGENQLHQIMLTLIEFRNAFDTLRTIQFPIPVKGRIEAGDLNHDGLFDLIVSGEKGDGQWVTQTFINQDTVFLTGRSWPGLKNATLKIADFDSDGKADIALQGQDTLGRALNWVATFSGDSLVLPTQDLLVQSFGDYDLDGDLDLVQISDTLGVVVLENEALVKNSRPSPPSNALGVFILDRLFLYWQKPGDDHTPSPALTYDLLLLSGQTETYSGEFDLKNSQRMTVSHGNQSSHNFSLLSVPVAGYSFQVQAVDNAFVGSHTNSGQCSGQECIHFETHTLNLCKDAPVTITSLQPLLWFSFTNGFLGKSDSLTIDSQTDTLFSFIPQNSFSCDMIKLYLLEKSAKDTLTISKNLITCEGKTALLFTDDEWQDVLWRDANNSQKGTGDTLHYAVTKDETLIANGHNSRGCYLKQTGALRVSKPKLSLNGDDFKILKGQSVTLHAFGANTYWWQPPQGLTNNVIADPVASPTETTSYTVTGFDSLNCTAEAKVLVEVEQTAFVPNLFTPNGDGKNDELRIYGLYQAKEFYFAVHNREGNIVYESRDLASVVSQGWDGSYHGVWQPPGLYYWKIEGSFDNGSPLYLNGKTKGSILLVR